MFLMYWYKFFDPSQMLILDGPDEKFWNYSQVNLQNSSAIKYVWNHPEKTGTDYES